MAGEKLRNIRYYLFRNGRYLEVARWNYLFEDGPASEVLKALKAYQNRDGGFGKGLVPGEADHSSSPLSTGRAIRILRELDFPPMAEGMIRRILLYLGGVPDFGEDGACGYDPCAELAGFALRFAGTDSLLYKRAQEWAGRMLAQMIAPDYPLEAQVLAMLPSLREDLITSCREDLLPPEFMRRLKERVDARIDRDPRLYAAGEITAPPRLFIHSRFSPFYPGNEEICAFYADYLEASVSAEGFWEPNGTIPFPEEARRAWRGILTVENMLFLQGMQEEDERARWR